MTFEVQPGSRLGRYVLETKIGGGTFGSVWRARDPDHGALVAIKLLGPTAGVDQAALRAEVELLAATAANRSSHVVKVLGGGSAPVPHVVMEYIDGHDLASILTERGALPQNEVVDIGVGIAVALEALAAAAIVHRDVKPANVLIDGNGIAKLADFGIAKIVGFETITMTGQLPMTMAYAAPEAWEGAVTHQSDLYAMGVVLYQCLVGEPPFTGNYGALYKHHTSTPPDLDRLPLETPRSLRELVGACLEKEPRNRPRDAAACVALLQKAAAELTAPPVREPLQFGPWKKRAPHPVQPWAWRCVHEDSGAQATVEVHAFARIEDAEALRRAMALNAAIVPLGAERLLGMNRLVLRPEEAWAEDPGGELQFWLARDEQPPPVSPSDVSVPRLRRTVDALAIMIAAAARAGVRLALDPPHLALGESGVRLARPGIATSDDDSAAAAMAFVRSLPLDEDAAALVAQSSGLDDLHARLGAPPGQSAIGVARVSNAQDAQPSTDGSTIIERSVVTPEAVGSGGGPSHVAPLPAGGSPPAPPPAHRAMAFGDWPRRYLYLAGALAGGLMVAAAASALFLFNRSGSAANVVGPGRTPTPRIVRTAPASTATPMGGLAGALFAIATAEAQQTLTARVAGSTPHAGAGVGTQRPESTAPAGNNPGPAQPTKGDGAPTPAATSAPPTERPTPVPTSTPRPTPTTAPVPTATQPPLPRFGDMNLDGRVDCTDKTYLTEHWLQSGSRADLSQDGTVDIDDLVILLANLDPGVVCGHSPDINRDGVVNSADETILIGEQAGANTPTATPGPNGTDVHSCFGRYPPGSAAGPSNPCDVNGDSIVDVLDLSVLLSTWSTSPPPTP